jgi:glycosyltransferase involved in cell wall biosynthesis
MNLNLMASFGLTGYGIAGYQVFKALRDRGVQIALFLTPEEPVAWVDKSAMQQALGDALFFDCHAPCLRIYHQFLLAVRVGRGKFVAYSFFELDPLPRLDVHQLNSTDLILMGSHWAKGVCERSGVTSPIEVVPLGIDPTIFHPPARQPGPGRPCSFLNVGKWEVRKGHQVLLEAFNATFSASDNVELWMMPDHYPFAAQERDKWHSLYRGSKLGQAGKIKIARPVNSHGEVAELMRMATCGVFPAFGEGFNLELLEMMACGKPVIATNYSAHTEYCNANNALLIEGSALTLARDECFFTETEGNWLQWDRPQMEQLCHHLRSVYNRHQAGEDLLNVAGLETTRHFTWDDTASKMIQHVWS